MEGRRLFGRRRASERGARAACGAVCAVAALWAASALAAPGPVASDGAGPNAWLQSPALAVLALVVPALFGLAWVCVRQFRALERVRNALAEERRASDAVRHIFEQAPVGIFQSDAAGRLLEINPFMAHMGGYDDPAAALGEIRDLAEQWYAQPREREEVLRRLRRDGQVNDFEYQVRRRNGTLLWVSMSARLTSRPGEDAAILEGFCIDITQRKRAEALLLRRFGMERLVSSLSARFLNLSPEELDEGVRASLAALGDAAGADRVYVFLFDPEMTGIDNTHLWRGPEAPPLSEAVRGLPIGDMHWIRREFFAGRTVVLNDLESLPPEAETELRVMSAEQVGSLMLVPLVSRYTLRGCIGMDTVRRQRAWSRGEAALLETVGGLVVAALERARFEADILAARDQAEAAGRTKDAFLAAMSHEIRTPMNAIVGMAEVLAETELDEEQCRYVGVFRKATEGLLRIIDDVLHFSRLEAGRVELESIPFAPAEALHAVLDPHAESARAKGLAFDITIAPDTPAQLLGDPGRLGQVLGNLAGNAVKFTERGGVGVLVRPAGEEEGKVLVRFEVRDTGIGIPEDKQGLIFETFAQADAATTRRFGGTGLGLAISQRLVTLMGGELRVHSEPGVGSVFHFTLPLEAMEAAAEAPDAAGAETLPELAGARVLVVDDSPYSRETLRAYLRLAGAGPAEAESAARARELFAAGEFRAVLVDMQMQDEPGCEIVASLRALEAGPAALRAGRAVMVGLTGQVSEEALRRGREAGCDGMLTKPVRRATLLRTLAELLGIGPTTTPPESRTA